VTRGTTDPVGRAGSAGRWIAQARARWQRLAGTPFGRDLALVLLLKVALVVALYVFLFRPAFHPAHDSVATAAAVAGSNPEVPREVSR
jgi:hypothetical protein